MLCFLFPFFVSNCLHLVTLFINSLFFGGHWPINIEAIWLVETAQEFDRIMKGITYLDAMLSGADMCLVKPTQEEVSTLNSLFDHFLKKKTTRKHPHYIYSAFSCFVKHKTHIQLRFCSGLDQYADQMRNLIMHSVDMSEYDHGRREYGFRNYIIQEALDGFVIKRRKEGDLNNLFRSELLQIFTGVKTITIDAGYGARNSNKYTFSLLTLLSLIETSAVRKVLIFGGEWLDWNTKEHWKQEPKELIQRRYNRARYNIKVEFLKDKLYRCLIESYYNIL